MRIPPRTSNVTQAVGISSSAIRSLRSNPDNCATIRASTAPSEISRMSMMDIQVEKQYSFCGLSLRCATQCCTAAQAMICLVLGVLYRVLLEPSVIVNILVGIHLVCAALSLVFLVFCFIKRKFGSFYEVLLHAYLLSILLMALTSLFAVMFLPLSFLQQSHSLGEGMHYLFLFLSAAGMLTLQFMQRNLVEQMLPVMEHCFV
ncbi:hypothetical protein Y032_0310g2108 [Ancylostoma ceylanicum]|nr:hypothetical protein Y032_0310g2108 [Ancylostoma ceylanicum]